MKTSKLLFLVYLSPSLGMLWALQATPTHITEISFLAEIAKGGIFAIFSLLLLYMYREDRKHSEIVLAEASRVLGEVASEMQSFRESKACVYSRREHEDIVTEIMDRERRDQTS